MITTGPKPKAYVDAVARRLAAQLHHARPGLRCRCGQCRHLIIATGRRTGIPVARLMAALPPEGKPKQERRRQRPALTGQVSSSMSVLRHGQRFEGPSAVLALLDTQL